MFAVFKGQVAAAFNAPVIDYVHNVASWGSTLDYVGVDCYYNHSIELHGFKDPNQQASQIEIGAGW